MGRRDEDPVVIRELDDDQAVVAMVDSNLHRENLKPSEKAFAYKMKLDAMKYQEKRLSDDSLSDNGAEVLAGNETNHMTSAQVGPKCGTDGNGRADNSGNRANEVIEEHSMMNSNELHAVMDLEQCTSSLSQANRMKWMSQSGELDMDDIYSVLEEEKPNQREQIKIRADTLDDYFTDGFTPKQKVELIEKFVKEWHKKQVTMKEGNRQRCKKNDPYLETREKEDAFADRIVEKVERKVLSNLPAMLGLYVVKNNHSEDREE